MSETVERPIEYWDEIDDPADEAFWIKDAMQSAVGIWWFSQRKTTEPLSNVSLTVDRERGVVTLREIGDKK